LTYENFLDWAVSSRRRIRSTLFEVGPRCKYSLPKMDAKSSHADKSDFSSANGEGKIVEKY
jgi:hypothetical protein